MRKDEDKEDLILDESSIKTMITYDSEGEMLINDPREKEDNKRRDIKK